MLLKRLCKKNMPRTDTENIYVMKKCSKFLKENSSFSSVSIKDTIFLPAFTANFSKLQTLEFQNHYTAVLVLGLKATM